MVDCGQSAEQLKNKGNDALREGRTDDAIELYSQSIGKFMAWRCWCLDLEKTEGALTNRAAAYIKQKKYQKALEDSELALLLNANFAKAHVRAYTCYIQ